MEKLTIVKFQKVLKHRYVCCIIIHEWSDNMGKNNNITSTQLKEWGEVTSYIREIAKKNNVDLSKILLVKKEKL